MSLKVWLPLNGNLENQGLEEIEVANVGATVNSSGKIGECYSFSSSPANYLVITGNVLHREQPEYSIAFWAKCTSNSPTSLILSNRTTTSSNQRSIFLYGQKTFYFDEGNRWTATSSVNYNATEWTHYVFTKKNSTRKIYINGQLAASNNTATTPETTSDTTIFIGNTTTTNNFSGLLNDYRIYDHCLSEKEVKEISKCLVLHYMLEGIITGSMYTEYDCSGFGNNGIKNGNFTYSADTPRYDSSACFNGNNYIFVGQKLKSIKDSITISFWGYMSDWTKLYNNDQTALVSCLEQAGWGFIATQTSLAFYMGTGTTINYYKHIYIPLADIPSGWHYFCGTYDGFSVKFYIDNQLIGESEKSSSAIPIIYDPTNSLFVGAEAGESATEPYCLLKDGKLSDLRIYATALSLEEINELRQTSVMIDNDCNAYAYSFEEV